MSAFTVSVAMTAGGAAWPAELTALAAQWRIALSPAGAGDALVLLWDEGLCLNTPDGARVTVDFTSGAVDYRRRRGGGRGQAIARAVGLKKGNTPFVMDATAGFGRDAFVLASLGCRVLMTERSAMTALLLADGLRRARQSKDIGAWIEERLTLKFADSRMVLEQTAERPDVIYLDPMFPQRRKSALVKKEMKALQALAGEDPDAGNLLSVALAAARDRVVVKRPATAPDLGGMLPDTRIRTKKHRFDVYLNRIGV